MNNTEAMTVPQHKWLHSHSFLHSHRFNPALQYEIHSKTVHELFSSEFLQFPHTNVTLLCSILTRVPSETRDIPEQAAYYHEHTSGTAFVENETEITQRILKIE